MSLVSSALSFLAFFSLLAQVLADVPAFHNDQGYKDGYWGNYSRQHFITEEFWGSPVPNILVSPQPGVSPSTHIMFTPASPKMPRANPILLNTDDLSVAWYGPRIGDETLGGTIQECNNTKYITFWTGNGAEGWKEGQYYLLDENYNVKYNVSGQGDFQYADAHELYLTPLCTGIFTAYKERALNVTMGNYTSEYVLDSYFQEIDIATGELLFQWNASQHIDIFDSYWNASIRDEGHTADNGFDWFHINSVQKDRKGNYLVSTRHMHAIYYISGHTGNVIWQVGGKKNMFKDLSDGYATDFSWQHHARWVDDDMTKVSFFDNRNTGWHHDERQPISRGAIISLDFDKKEVKLEREYRSTTGARAFREGSMQVLRDSPSPRNVIVGFGMEPAFTEYAENGTVLWDVAFSPLGKNRWSPDNYRFLKVNWTGAPLTMPKIAPGPRPMYLFDNTTNSFNIPLKDNSGYPLTNDTAYFSWNGATDLKSWVVLASNDTADLDMRHFWAEVPRQGFETSCFVGAGTRHVTVLAINKTDHVIGQSGVLDMTDFGMVDGLNRTVVNGTDGKMVSLYDRAQLGPKTEMWKKFVKSQSGNKVFKKLHAQWHDVKTSAMQTSAPVAAGIGAGVTVLVLGIVAAVVVLVMRRRRGQSYMRARTTDEELTGLRRGEKEDACFSVAMDEDDEDDSDEESRVGSYYDEPFGYKKGESGSISEGSTLRSCSTSTVDKDKDLA
ncbi:hypothetical protein C1H76_5066 [Elsinoe australis]|uniref:ASST-domain-containing protein n=1 Tax=Elsinoe australis TaxID=40998 RepID=A0A4U7AWY1_9PEZI|nr:hypothetical protein C1H76_5066 [Elsinoe australis]